MALPEEFDSAYDYFEESLRFFRRHQNLFNFPNTKLLSTNCLENIDIQGLKELNINIEGLKLEDIAERNDFLNDFLRAVRRLTVDFGNFKDEKLENIIGAPLSLKKKHEIAYLANEIDILCETIGCRTVVDFGSGLGYLDQLLFERSDFNVLGLECNEHHYVSAKNRQRKYHENSKEKVKYIRHKIGPDSDLSIKEYLSDKFSKSNGFCIAGLHACADLTIDAIDIFLKMADAKAIILMSCCYHKMCFETEGDRQTFKNFPLSNCLKEINKKHNGSDYLKIPFLRLAAQPPSTCELLNDLVFNLLARCVVQKYADKYGFNMTRRKRKAVKTKRIENDFESYIQQAVEGFRLTCNNDPCVNADDTEIQNNCKCNLQFDVEELRNYWRAFPKDMTLRAAIFILIQRSLQPVFENFILYDRIIYLYEKGNQNCRIKKTVDQVISPRCLALLATK